MSTLVYFKLHVNSASGERDILACLEADLGDGFYRVREKGTENRFTVYRHKLPKIQRKVKK